MTLIIGDIHGCYNELQALLDKAGIGDDEPIIALGDLFDRGPCPEQVFDFFTSHPNTRSVRGNHEQRHINAGTQLVQRVTRVQFDTRYRDVLAYMETLPLYIKTKEARLVHGYYEPGLKLKQQRDSVLLGRPAGEIYLKRCYQRPWYQLYTRKKPLIVGHRDYTGKMQPLIIEGRLYAIDTRCVYGGSLTGIKLPQWELISVAARENYAKSFSEMFGPD